MEPEVVTLEDVMTEPVVTEQVDVYNEDNEDLLYNSTNSGVDPDEGVAIDYMKEIRQWAEIRFDQNSGNYNGLCGEASNVSALINQADLKLGGGRDKYCSDGNNSYIVWISLNDSEVYCVDSRGVHGKFNSSLIGEGMNSCEEIK